MYTVWGLVDANGTVKNGSRNPSTNLHNFAISPSSGTPGIFFVQFNPWFAGIPAVVVQHVGAFDSTVQASGLFDSVTVESVTQYVMVVVTGDDKGNITPRNFSFVAIGEASMPVTADQLSKASTDVRELAQRPFRKA